jgi:hypothetical protein
VCYVVFGYAGATLALRPLRRVVPRGAGAPVAAACGAFRTGLAQRPPADERAASGDRRPAYAMAFGLTRAASPFEPGGHVVWSPCSGRWLRVVPGGRTFGTSPAVVLISLVPSLLSCAIWLVPLGYLTGQLTWDRIGRVWPVLLLGLGWTLWAAGTFVFLRWLGGSVSDLVTRPRVIVGPVVHLESSRNADRFSIAVDDGIADQVTRYPVGRELYDRLRHGSWLRLEVRRTLGSVVRADVLPH